MLFSSRFTTGIGAVLLASFVSFAQAETSLASKVAEINEATSGRVFIFLNLDQYQYGQIVDSANSEARGITTPLVAEEDLNEWVNLVYPIKEELNALLNEAETVSPDFTFKLAFKYYQYKKGGDWEGAWNVALMAERNLESSFIGLSDTGLRIASRVAQLSTLNDDLVNLVKDSLPLINERIESCCWPVYRLPGDRWGIYLSPH